MSKPKFLSKKKIAVSSVLNSCGSNTSLPFGSTRLHAVWTWRLKCSLLTFRVLVWQEPFTAQDSEPLAEATWRKWKETHHRRVFWDGLGSDRSRWDGLRSARKQPHLMTSWWTLTYRLARSALSQSARQTGAGFQGHSDCTTSAGVVCYSVHALTCWARRMCAYTHSAQKPLNRI